MRGPPSCDVDTPPGCSSPKLLQLVLKRYGHCMVRSLHSRRPATLASLAAELGVSRTTVSNAYNRPDQLSPQLRQRVLDTARRLGYPGPDPVGFLEGMALACEEAGTGLLLVPAAPGGLPDPGIVHRAAVDGFVVYSM